jgi:hypothetical protein
MQVGSLVVWLVDYEDSIEKKSVANPELEVGIVLGFRDKLTENINEKSCLVFWSGKKNSSGWTKLSFVKKFDN